MKKIGNFITMILDGISTFHFFPEKSNFDYAKWQTLSLAELEAKNKKLKQTMIGQWLGFALLIALMFISFALIMKGHDAIGAIVALLWLSIMVYAKSFHKK